MVWDVQQKTDKEMQQACCQKRSQKDVCEKHMRQMRERVRWVIVGSFRRRHEGKKEKRYEGLQTSMSLPPKVWLPSDLSLPMHHNKAAASRVPSEVPKTQHHH
jgi:hypothetical protein